MMEPVRQPLVQPIPHHTARRVLLGLAAVFTLLVVLGARPAISQAACTSNPVACENAQTGSPQADWFVDGFGDDSIQGFATQQSVDVGGTESFKIKSSSTSYHVDIYRLGYYGGAGARLVAGNLKPTGPSTQPACNTDSSTGLVDCGNWDVSLSWSVPSTAVSGVYTAHLVRSDGADSQIEFVVRDDSSHSQVVVQTSDASWQAYNDYGGNSLYTCTVACPPGDPHAYKAAYAVSYNRPLQTEGQTELFSGAEYSMIRFLEQEGYDVSYVSSSDVAEHGNLLLNHKIFISSGHDEYWSASQRANLEAARDAGVSEAFFSGNEGFWKTRWAADPNGNADRVLMAYKDTHFDQREDPVTWTGSWRDPRFTTPSENTPENALTGQSFVVNSGTTRITVPYAYRNLRIWHNTAATSLSPGQSLELAPDTLGYEWDADADNGYRPKGEIDLSSTTASNVEVFTDYGSTTQFGQTATHNLSLYKAASGALVFGAGTVQWAWGLSDWNPGDNPADRNMQQATVNLFADMGAQPATLSAGLVATTKTTDATPPTVTLDAPPSSVADGATVTLTGSASDSGGQVGGVEVSTDGGSTWHPATGTTSWSYAWIAHGAPSATIKVRATDDSGNTSTPTGGASVNVTCPCSLWGNSVTPAQADGGDGQGVEVGLKFTADKFGTVSGIRFYKASTNTGTHIGSLWTADGTRLAQATFSNESASGWQTVTFASPVTVQPDTTYVASYYAPNGHYSVSPNYFYRAPSPGPDGGATSDAPPLHAVLDSATETNGVYAYGASSTFPINSYGAGNYGVDVLFTPTAPPGQVTGVSATEGGRTSANVTWSAPSSGGAPTSYEITPYVGSTAQTPKTVDAAKTNATVTGLATGTTYTFTVTATNPNGSGPESAKSNGVTPTGPVAPSAPTGVHATPASSSAQVTWTAADSDGDSPITGQTVTPFIGSTAQTPVSVGASATSATVTGLTDGQSYTFKVSATNAVGDGPQSSPSGAVVPQSTIFDFATPDQIDSGDAAPLEVGVKFTADYDGSITGIRFYKAAANTGTHTGSLWTASGTRLAQATFTDETSSGWQTATFANPVAVTAGTTYVASYFTPSGHYSDTNAGLASPTDNPPLHALGNTTSPNGVYAYGGTSTFPNLTYNGANYWVDVMYAVPQPGAVSNVSAVEAGKSAATVSWTAPAGGGPVASYRITPYVGATAQTAKTVTAPATSGTVTGLSSGTTYTFTVAAVNASGAGPESAKSNSVTPSTAVVPTAPANVVARPATKSARVSWSASSSDGDSAITSQTVTPYKGSTAQTPVTVGASATDATITGLDNGSAYTFKVTATNGVGDSAPSSASNAVTPEDTIYDFASPGTADSGDTLPVELGVKWTADFDGSVTGIRFYKASTNTGTHVGSLWTSDGSRLAQATFANETGSGWQTVTFANPVAVTAGTTYVASYFAPNGHYAVTNSGLGNGADNAPLHALADSDSPNGVYAYGSSSTFPSGSYHASDYGVDVLFDPAPPPGAVSNVTATAGQASATVSWSAPTTGGRVTSYRVTPYIGSAAQTAKTVDASATSTTIGDLAGGTSYTFTVTPSNPDGAGPESAKSNAITPTGAAVPTAPTGVAAQADSKAAIVTWNAPSSDGGNAVTGYTVTPFVDGTAQPATTVSGSSTGARLTGLTDGTAYTFTVAAKNSVGPGPASAATDAVTPRASIFESTTPDTADSGDGSSIVVGVKFTSDVAGSITGIRFHKAAANTGTHVGSLWSATGDLLASGTFTNETPSGWQALTFATPVAITAGTTYVAGYLAPNGHYSATGNAFGTGPVDNSPLHALANSTSTNGVYAYSATNVFPTSNFGASNYWVDVLFAPGS